MTSLEPSSPLQDAAPSLDRHLVFDWTATVLGSYWLGGLFVDGWAHNHIPTLETFFTPWHAILYSGFFVVGIFYVVVALRNHARGTGWREALPPGYGLSLLGVGIFAVGGVLDLIWHQLFGIERSLAATLSPTHLMLALGIFLAVGGPWRAAWQRSRTTNPENFWHLLPMILSLTSLLAILLFFTQYANPIIHSWADKQTAEPMQDLGLVSVLIQTATLMGILLLAMRRWRLPFGTITVLFLLPTVLAGVLASDSPVLAIAVLALLNGLLLDGLYALLHPSLDHPQTVRLFAFVAPLLIQSIYYLSLQLVHGIAWPIHLWAGSIALAGVVGLFLSYLLIPPALPEARKISKIE